MAAIAFFCIELLSPVRTFFWWSGAYISGNYLLFSGITVLIAGIVGMYGAVIGKKRGAVLMFATGIIILLSASLLFTFIGIFMLAGGIFTIREKPQQDSLR
jgi:hypothetical protein